jgi:hypothetical protein
VGRPAFQKINEFYGTLTDENAKAQFRADYVRLAETRFGVPQSRSDTNNDRLAALIFLFECLAAPMSEVSGRPPGGWPAAKSGWRAGSWEGPDTPRIL